MKDYFFKEFIVNEINGFEKHNDSIFEPYSTWKFWTLVKLPFEARDFKLKLSKIGKITETFKFSNSIWFIFLK